MLMQDTGHGPWHQGDAVNIVVVNRGTHNTVTLVGPRHLIEAIAQFLTDQEPPDYAFYKATVGRHDD